MNQLASFQAAEAQLRPWLMEKELMMSVLGPLSIDPNMLNAQKQQVQVSWEPRTHRHGGVGSRRGECLIQYVKKKIALRVICRASDVGRPHGSSPKSSKTCRAQTAVNNLKRAQRLSSLPRTGLTHQ